MLAGNYLEGVSDDSIGLIVLNSGDLIWCESGFKWEGIRLWSVKWSIWRSWSFIE